jgi:NAD(P)H-hydrate epimerase
VSIDKSDTYLTSYPEINSFSALGIGPGIGQELKTVDALKKLLNNVEIPMIIDADALNIIGNNKHMLDILPENTILTPHPKEFERIAGKSENDYSRNLLQQEFSRKHKLIVVLKGAYTAITDTNGCSYFNTSGNPGMATAGSGDVLTGIILSFLSQGYSPINSALLGVYIHGLAGDLFVESNSEDSLCASDLINKLGSALKMLK